MAWPVHAKTLENNPSKEKRTRKGLFKLLFVSNLWCVEEDIKTITGKPLNLRVLKRNWLICARANYSIVGVVIVSWVHLLPGHSLRDIRKSELFSSVERSTDNLCFIYTRLSKWRWGGVILNKANCRPIITFPTNMEKHLPRCISPQKLKENSRRLGGINSYG